ncbi:hypothetical protein HDU93_006202 [Gonapodya sp. JEL0774]|nr:hypothetical protein HDU93_006202 [Gonapodya sp. JEL0774]
MPILPTKSFVGHQANIFSIAFSSDNRYLYTGANDGLILSYDIEHSNTHRVPGKFLPTGADPTRTTNAHAAAVLKISLHPFNSSLLLSCGQDGFIRLWDVRVPSGSTAASAKGVGERSVGFIECDNEQNCVAWNPAVEHFFASAGNRNDVVLRDARMAFSHVTGNGDRPLRVDFDAPGGAPNWKPVPSNAHISQSTDGGIVQVYNTHLARGNRHSIHADCSSVVWNSSGTVLGAVLQRYYPVLYAIGGSEPVCVLTDNGGGLSTAGMNEAGQEGHDVAPQPGFRNCTTVKSPSFGSFGYECSDLVFPAEPRRTPGQSQDGQEYFTCGSDDFRGYVWQIPTVSHMRQNTRTMLEQEDPTEIYFCSSGRNGLPTTYTRPHTISRALWVLPQHRSIVNSSIWHPTMPWVITSGVEKFIRVHSVVKVESGCEAELSDGITRADTDNEDGHSTEALRSARRTLGRGPIPLNVLARMLGDDSEDEEGAQGDVREVDIAHENETTLLFFDYLIQRESRSMFGSRHDGSTGSEDNESEESSESETTSEGSTEDDVPSGLQTSQTIVDDDEEYIAPRERTIQDRDWMPAAQSRNLSESNLLGTQSPMLSAEYVVESDDERHHVEPSPDCAPSGQHSGVRVERLASLRKRVREDSLLEESIPSEVNQALSDQHRAANERDSTAPVEFRRRVTGRKKHRRLPSEEETMESSTEE